MSRINYQPGVPLALIEQDFILGCLRFYSGNRTAAAKALGISTRTILNRIQEYRSRGVEIPPAMSGLRMVASDDELLKASEASENSLPGA